MTKLLRTVSPLCLAWVIIGCSESGGGSGDGSAGSDSLVPSGGHGGATPGVGGANGSMVPAVGGTVGGGDTGQSGATTPQGGATAPPVAPGNTGAGGATAANPPPGSAPPTNPPPSGSTDTSASGPGDTSGDGPTGSEDATDTSETPPPEPEPTLVTSSDGAFWQIGEAMVTEGNANVTIELSQEFQRWEGFGGTFNEAGWDALSEVSEADREKAIQLLFDSRDGAGFDWGRIPMGASDYALERYVLMTGDPMQADPEMERFSIERDRQYLIPYIKAALAINPKLRMWASPWTPPPWMKEPAQFDGYVSEQVKATMKTDPTVLSAYAQYFVKFIQDYAEEGIHVEHVQPQNEPGYTTRYPSCSWSGSLLATFIADHLGPAFENAGLDTEIWLGTLSNDAEAPGILNAVLSQNTNAKGYVKGVGLQWNTTSHIASLAGDGFHVMQTEHRCGNYHWLDSFRSDAAPNDYAYAEESWQLIHEWVTKGVHSYLAWNMILDTVGANLDTQRPWPQNALLTVNRQSQTLNITPAYYVFRHVSQYVDPGAMRVGVTGASSALAFKNPDGAVVAIFYNAGGQPQSLSVGVSDSVLAVTVPARGWATLNWQ